VATGVSSIAMEEVVAGTVYLVTKNTITKYNKLFFNPLLRDGWIEVMYNKLGRLVQ
jgi:hypothetical protein